MHRKKLLIPFTSAMSKGETVATLLFLPVYLWLLPLALVNLVYAGRLSEIGANLLCYAISLAFMLIAARRFLRRDFDPLCDNLLFCVREILGCYILMLCMNMLVALVLQSFVPSENQNNQALMEMAKENYGSVAAMTIFIAPIVEELLFRGGIFGALRRYSRAGAYIGSMIAFSLCHVVGYALADPTYWIYLLQYLPASFLLCRCYERTNSIWSSIFLHMLINSVSIQILSELGEML